MDQSSSIVGLIVILIIVLPILSIFVLRSKNKKLQQDIEIEKSKVAEVENKYEELESKYKPITDIEAEADRIHSESQSKARSLIEEQETLTTEAKEVLKGAKDKANDLIFNAQNEADEKIEYAIKRAEEIAGNALEAKSNADSYESAIKAMKNTIDGYKDEYIIPNSSVLDDLAEEYSHKEAGEKLKLVRKQLKDMVKQERAGSCDYAEPHRKRYAIHFAVDAFNGKVDSALAKVKHDNFGKIKQQIIDAFALVNHNGHPFRNARINQEYLDKRLEELKWAVATYELRQQELAEQRVIKEQIREEERARREMEKAIKEAEKEERLLQKALDKARYELAKASEEQKQQYEMQLSELEEKLKEAEARGERALSMAQQTKRGHVYVISNIGSFGEEVFKVGMTRRLEPLDRVKELGDASVPFSFDVHAMIYSEDAPSLEKTLHKKFFNRSVNKVNPRKEFFKLPLSEIKQAVTEHGVEDIHWTLKAEATEYRESISISESQDISLLFGRDKKVIVEV